VQEHSEPGPWRFKRRQGQGQGRLGEGLRARHAMLGLLVWCGESSMLARKDKGTAALRSRSSS